MIYIDKSNHHVTLHCYLMSEDSFAVSWSQRVNQQGEVLGTGYLLQSISSRVYSKNGKGLGMLHRLQEHAQLGVSKRNNRGTKNIGHKTTEKAF